MKQCSFHDFSGVGIKQKSAEPPSTQRREGEAMAKWRPIESAPKDGTPILITDIEQPSAGLLIARWKMDAWWGLPTPRGNCTIWPDATHWMPLPKAPEALGEPS